MNEVVNMDELDKQILREYQKDASMSYKLLAKKVKRPVSTVFSRIENMKKTGVIQALIPLVDPFTVGKKQPRGLT